MLPKLKKGARVVSTGEITDYIWRKPGVIYTVMQNYNPGDEWIYVYSSETCSKSYAVTGGGMLPVGYESLKLGKGIKETSDMKPTNPKDAVGIKKVPMSVIPANVLMEVALGNFEGARKYGRHNYRKAGVRYSVYYDATLRHLMAWWEGQDNDPDSGLSHVTKAICGLIVLRDSMMRGNATDDRPPPSESDFMEHMNKLAASIIEKYPDAKPAILAKE